MSKEHGLHVRAAEPVAPRRNSEVSRRLATNWPSDKSILDTAGTDSQAGHLFAAIASDDDPEIKDQHHGHRAGSGSTHLAQWHSSSRARLMGDDPYCGRTVLDYTDADTANDNQVGSINSHCAPETDWDEAETIVVASKASGLATSKRVHHHDDTVTDPDDFSIFTNPPAVTPSRSRRFALPDAPKDTDIAPVNWNDPDDEDSWSPEFSLVIALDGQWHALACRVCGANAPLGRINTGFFSGGDALLSHIKLSHPDSQMQEGLDELRACIDRTFDEADLEQLRKGKQPISGSIKEVRNRKRKNVLGSREPQAQPSSVLHQNTPVSGTILVKHGRSVSDSPLVRPAPETHREETANRVAGAALGYSGVMLTQHVPPMAQMMQLIVETAAGEVQQQRNMEGREW